jgi:hypothetical protein
MKALALAFALISTTAAAEVRIHNATQTKMKVDVTLPNGKVESATLDEAIDSIDDEKWTLAAGVKDVKVAISDDSGKEVWRGTVGANGAGVIVPAGKGATFVPAGTYSGGSETWRAAVIMNITGDAITLDLEGQNGLAAHRNITPPSSLDLKKAIKLDPREATFSTTLKVRGGEPIALEGSSVTPGQYYVLWKRSRDSAYRLLAAGYLPPPPKAKRPKN